MIFPDIVWVALLAPALVIAFWIVTEVRSGRDIYALRRVRRYGRGVADLLPYASLIHPDVVLNKDGALMTAYEFAGDDATSLGYAEMRRRIAVLNRAFLTRDAGWMLHFDLVRHKARPRSAPAYVRGDAERVLEETHRGGNNARYRNRLLLAVTYLPPTDAGAKASNWVFEGDSTVQASFERAFDAFERGLRDMEDQLGAIGNIRRLAERRITDDRGGVTVQNELLEALVDVMYGIEQPVTVPDAPFLLPGLLGVHDLHAGIRPRIAGKHIGVLSIAGFPAASYPGILDRLQRVEGEFRFSTRLIFEDTVRARKKLDEAYRNWFSKRLSLAAKALASGTQRVNRDADAMTDDAENALAALDRGLVRYVYYSGKCVILADDLAELEATKRELTRVLSGVAGFLVRDEDLNAVEGYLGTLWGDGYHDVRKYMLHTINAGDMLLTTSEWGGRTTSLCQYCPPDIEPMATVRTRGGADFALDVHHRDVMHTAILGETGGGKTTLLNFLAGNFARTPTDQFIGLDFNYGMYSTCAFLGGQHIDPLGHGGSLRFGLFTYLDEPGERAFLVELLATTAALSGVPVTPADRDRLEKALERMESTEPAFRSLTTFLQKLNDRDGSIRMALQPYTIGGSLNGILDGTGDDFADANYQVIELSSILGGGDAKERVVAPVMMLLLRRIERRLKASRRTFVAIDEAWAHLRSSIVLPHVEEMLRTYRRKHAGVGLATQSIGDIVDSPLAMTLIDACMTKILLPNPNALGSQRAFYREVGCSDAEIAAIATAAPKKEYFLKARDGSAMIDLRLSRAELAIYGRASATDIEELRRFRTRQPESWREDLLRARGCADAADRLADLRTSNIRSASARREGLAIA